MNRRNLLAGLCGLAVTTLMVVVTALVLLRFAFPPDQLTRIAAGQPSEIDAVIIDRLAVTSRLVGYLVYPVAAAAAGASVALIASSGLWILAVVSVLPLAGVQLSANVTVESVALSIGYAVVAYLTCRGIRAWRTRV